VFPAPHGASAGFRDSGDSLEGFGCVKRAPIKESAGGLDPPSGDAQMRGWGDRIVAHLRVRGGYVIASRIWGLLLVCRSPHVGVAEALGLEPPGPRPAPCPFTAVWMLPMRRAAGAPFDASEPSSGSKGSSILFTRPRAGRKGHPSRPGGCGVVDCPSDRPASSSPARLVHQLRGGEALFRGRDPRRQARRRG
jgi:hypothetical protein